MLRFSKLVVQHKFYCSLIITRHIRAQITLTCDIDLKWTLALQELQNLHNHLTNLFPRPYALAPKTQTFVINPASFIDFLINNILLIVYLSNLQAGFILWQENKAEIYKTVELMVC